MKKSPKKYVLLSAFLIPAFLLVYLSVEYGLQFDIECRPVPLGDTFCQKWSGFEWETVLAGALGFFGGILVVLAARHQIEIMQETTDAQISSVQEATKITLHQARLHKAQEYLFPQQKTLDLVSDMLTRYRAARDIFQIDMQNIKTTQTDQTPSFNSININLSVMRKFFLNTGNHLERTIEHYGPAHFNFKSYRSLSLVVEECKYLDEINQTIESNNLEIVMGDVFHFLSHVESHLKTSQINLLERISEIKEDFRLTDDD